MPGKTMRDVSIKLEIEQLFTYHAPKPDQIARYGTLRDAGKELAILLIDTCPDSRERDQAIDKLREAIMWANASIACNE